MIAAILRAQWLSMRMGGRRGAIFSIITGVVWYGIWLSAAAAGAILASQADAEELGRYLPIAFLAICAYWQIVPVLSASMGSGLDMRKLLVYPIPPRNLFVVEVLLRLITGAEMIMVLAGGAIGLLLNHTEGGWRALPRIVTGNLLLIVFNILLASGLRSLLERLLTKRKVREFLTFVLLLLYAVPRLMFQTGTRFKAVGSIGEAMQALGLPWTAAARITTGGGGFQWLALVSLCGWTLAALWFGRAQFDRSLRYDVVAAQATPLAARSSRWAEWTERFYRFPSLVLRDPLACLVEKELRSLARTPRFRMVFIMGFTFGLVVWFPAFAGRRTGISSGTSPYFLAIVCVYAVTLLGQVTYWNCFGFDRSAVVFYFAAPQPLSRTLLGKNLAVLFFIYLEVLILIGVTAALGVSGGWRTTSETLLVVGVSAVYLMALGNIASVQYPRGLVPERVSQGGASTRFQGLIFVLYPIALLPVFLAYLARYAFDSELVFLISLAIAAIGGGVLYAMALESAVGTAKRRREQIQQELSQGDGPVAAH